MSDTKEIPSEQKINREEKGRKPISTAAIVALGVVAVLVAGLLLVSPILDGMVKPALIEAVNTGGGDSIAVGRMRYNLFSNTVVARNVALRLRDTTTTGARTISVVAAEVDLADVNWLRLLFGSLSLGNVAINNVHCRIDIDTLVVAAETAEQKQAGVARDSALIEQLAEALPRRFCPLHVERLTIRNADVVRRVAGTLADSVAAISVDVREIAVDPDELRKGGKVWSSAELSTGAITTNMLGQYYAVKFESLRFLSSDSSLVIKSLLLQPVLPDEEFFAARRYRIVRFRVKAPELQFRRLRIEEYLRTNTLSAGAVVLNNPTFDIVLNKRMPPEPGGAPPKMPHQFFDSLSVSLQLDSLQFRNGRILYSELFPYTSKPAVLPFSAVNFDVTGIRHTPGKRLGPQPVSLVASGKLADAGLLRVHLDIPLDVDHLRFTARGSLGPMDPQALNSFLVVSDRIRIASGKVDNADFSLSVSGGRSTGVVNAEYIGLSIAVLDEETGSEKGLMPKLKTFVANAFALRANNPSFDKEKGPITYQQKPDDAFMDVLWLSIRSGLGELVGF